MLGFGARASAQDCDASLAAGDDLQAAIDASASGDTICLAAGLYSPLSTLQINKPLTLHGPQADVDPRPSSGSLRTAGDQASEAIIDGSSSALSVIINIAADDVSLNGLQIRSGSGDMIQSPSSPATTNTAIKYCIINNATGDEGVQLRASTDPQIMFNYIFNVAQDAVNVSSGSSGALIQYNEIHNSSSSNAAIYTYDNGPGGSSFMIASNLIYNVTANHGIYLGISNGADDTDPGGTVTKNTFYNVAKSAIVVQTSDANITANEIYDAQGDGAIVVRYDTSNVLINDNIIHDNGTPGGTVTYAVRVISTSHPTSVALQDNCIYGNEGGVLFTSSGDTLNAEDNWWGDSSGPGGAGVGSGDTVSADVDFTPFHTTISGCAPDSDNDGDPDQRDCAPSDGSIHREADELCDATDRNCDGSATAGATDIGSWYRDVDGDSYGTGTAALACEAPAEHVAQAGDCNDNAADVNPGEDELCDDIDHNCDNDTEANAVNGFTLYEDADGDGWGDPSATLSACGFVFGFVTQAGDCNDNDATVSPGMQEVCDGQDTDCDGTIDNKDQDQDGSVDIACGGDDCDDRDHHVRPEAAEACFDAIDNNCNGDVDETDAECIAANLTTGGAGGSGCNVVHSAEASWGLIIWLVAVVALRRRQLRSLSRL